jgi:hypothetical protein
MFVLLVPTTVLAQEPPRGSEQPLVIERMQNDFVVAPDFKVTDLDDRTGSLAGGYVGGLIQDALLVGGAGYWLTNRSSDFKMAYGGLLVGWVMPPEHRVQFGVRGLVGIGSATLGSDIQTLRGDLFKDRSAPSARFGSSPRPDGRVPTTVHAHLNDDFFVFEPQFTLVTKFTDHIGVNWGVGYRITGATDVLEDRLNGVTGSVAIQFGLH